MIRYMSDALREMTGTLRDVALLDVYAKTIKTLERLGNKFNNSKTRWNIEIPLTDSRICDRGRNLERKCKQSVF